MNEKTVIFKKYYPQTEENVKKEMEEWRKQADKAKSEGCYT